MSTNGHGNLVVGSLSNPAFPSCPEVEKALAARWNARVQELRRQAQRQPPARLVEEERMLIQRFESGLLSLLGGGGDLERLTKERNDWLDKVHEEDRRQRRRKPSRPWNPSPLAGSGEFWWAQANWSDETGWFAVAAGPDGIDFDGLVPWDSHTLYKHSLTFVAQFVLSPDRFPPATTFNSAPFADIEAAVNGRTFGTIFSTQDYWAKCWLNTAQTIYPLNSPSQPLVSQSASRNLVFIEGVLTEQSATVTGPLALPAVQFSIADRQQALGADLEFQFRFQLENSSRVVINYGVGADHAVLNGPQWNIIAVS